MARSSGWRLWGDVAPAALGVTETSMGVSRYSPHIPDDDGDVLEYYPQAAVRADRLGDESLPSFAAQASGMVYNEVDFS